MSEKKTQNEQQRLMELSKARLRNDSWQMHNSLSEFVRTVHPKTEKN